MKWDWSWASRRSSASSAPWSANKTGPAMCSRSWDAGELVETDSLEATLPVDENAEDSYVPVRFQSRITELGVFELWCVGTKTNGRWKLEFSVREDRED